VRALPPGNAGARRAAKATSAAPNFEVVAVNIDTRDPAKPLAFLKEVGVTHLAYYSDQSAKVFQDLKTLPARPSACRRR
jgi:predicted dehydrogenase